VVRLVGAGQGEQVEVETRFSNAFRSVCTELGESQTHARLEQPLMLKLLDRIPLGILIALAAWLAVAPIVPEPHVVEKLRLLWRGALNRPLDVFDLLFHVMPLVLLGIRLARMRRARRDVAPKL
jgi:hypothetical protein